MKIVLPDLISNSYFPAAAAVELGFCRDEGLHISLELLFPVDKAYQALAAGDVDFVAGSAHSALAGFPEWEGVRLLCAQAQGMYWFLVARADLAQEKGNLEILRGARIGAAPWVEMGLRRLLATAGYDLARDEINIGSVPGAGGPSVNFGLTAAKALEDGKIDAFWANGMAAELAVRSGVGKVVLDVRRGDGPQECFNYTMASIATTTALIESSPDKAAAMVRAVVRAQAALKSDVSLATKVGKRLFPEYEASLIADIVRRDLAYYDPSISREFVHHMNQFARDLGILRGSPAYESVVEASMVPLWK